MTINHSTAAHQKKDRLTIGLLTRKITYTWALAQMQGMVDACRQRDVNLICFPGSRIFYPDQIEEQRNIAYDLARATTCDGFIISTGAITKSLPGEEGLRDFYQRFHPRPIVGLDRSLAGVPTILKSEYEPMAEAITHLIEGHGYRRIAYINRIGAGPHQERYRAYVDTLAKYNIPYDPKLVFSVRANLTDFDPYQVRPGLDFEALATCDDHFALAAMKALQAQGVRVPGQVAIVGFDDVTESWAVTPPLTTVRPPFYEMGYKAVELLLALVAGEEVPDQVILPSSLVIRQSCGCMTVGPTPQDETLTTFAPVQSAKTATANPETLDAVLATQRSEIVAEIAQAVRPEHPDTVHAAQFWDSFVAELEGQAPGLFLRELHKILHQAVIARSKVRLWQNGLSVLRYRLRPYLDLNHFGPADDLWHHARMIIAEVAERERAYQAMLAEQQAQVLRQVSQELITTFKIESLMDILAENMPRLNFPACYLALYEDSLPYQYPQANFGRSRLMLAYYQEQERIELEPGGQLFPTARLLPAGMWPDRQFSFVVVPLYVGDNQLGFALFEMGPREGTPYEALRGQISSALQGALLVQQVQENAAEIARQKNILDTFMDSVPDTIYFKDRDSRITQVNRAYVYRFGLVHPAEIVGKTDFDLFPEEEARSKYEQEQKIIRTGQPILDLEEPDKANHWVLTTKMPLRDENNAIIGTFGISRDITELKQTQQDVEIANKEISALNERLKEENVRMSAELDIARRLQEMILPHPEELKQIEGLDIVGFMQPAAEVGGDYYDVLHKNGTTHIGIGDVTGHGLESGVLMLMAQTAIRTLIDHGETDPVRFVTTLNQTLYNNVRRAKMDKYLTFALVNFENGQLKIVGQHEVLLLVRKNGQVERVNTLDLGYPLALEEEIAHWVNQAMVELAPGEGIVLYTDGITEATNEKDELYGLERLCTVISQHWQASAEEIKQAVIEDVTRHIGQQIIYDDLTLVVLKQQ